MESRFLWRGLPPGRLNGLDALILNEPYTTVSLASSYDRSAVESRFLWRGLPPGRLNGLDALILNEPYTTVSLAPAMIGRRWSPVFCGAVSPRVGSMASML